MGGADAVSMRRVNSTAPHQGHVPWDKHGLGLGLGCHRTSTVLRWGWVVVDVPAQKLSQGLASAPEGGAESTVAYLRFYPSK